MTVSHINHAFTTQLYSVKFRFRETRLHWVGIERFERYISKSQLVIDNEVQWQKKTVGSESGGPCLRLGFAVLCKDPWPSDFSSLGLSFLLCKMRPDLYCLPYFITGLFWEPNEGACDKVTVMYKRMPWLWWHLVRDGSCPDLWTGQICIWNCSVIE